jgi:hypothetical protein
MNLIYGILGGIAALFVIIMLNRVRISLFIITMIHGRFSYEYMQFHKKRNYKSPHKPCITDDIYYHIIVFFKKKFKEHVERYNTDTQIEFDKFKFGENYKTIFNKKGIPDCFNILDMDRNEISILGYFNEDAMGVRVKSLFFFFDGEFIMGEYVFSDIKKIDTSLIIKSIRDKYLSNDCQWSDMLMIEEKNGQRMLNIENNGFSMSLRYYSKQNQEIQNKLKSYFHKMQLVFVDFNTESEEKTLPVEL